MPFMLKIGLVLLGAIFAVLAIFLLIGHMFGPAGTDSNNSNVHSKTSQRQ
jgi:hypothetical protein